MRFACFSATLVLLSFCKVSFSAPGSWWLKYYKGMDEEQSALPETFPVCVQELFWAILMDIDLPQCSGPWSYYRWQSNGKHSWCAEHDGTPIKYTMERVGESPYDCKRTRWCFKGTVREFSGRCEATCEEATAEGYDTEFHCENKCICPRGMYLDENDNCVWLDECPKPTCSSPMVYTSCASKCPKTCATPEAYCSNTCAEGVSCVCPRDMVYLSTRSKTCVKPEDCPKCEHGSIPTDRAPKCPKTCHLEYAPCEGYEKDVYCMCPPGTIRIDRKLPVRCVREDECPPQCEHPRIPKGCGTACPPTCDNPEPSCVAECVPENVCSCPDGYVQKSKTDKTCVTRAECMTEKLGCVAPARAEKCTGSCPKSCEAQGPICVRTCPSEYVCGCPDGYVQRSRDDADCIRVEICPPKCEPPKIFALCAPICQPTCQVPKVGSCRRGCSAQFCICPKGMVQLSEENQTCLDPSECPGCKAPAEPTECTTTCPATCQGTESSCRRRCDSKYVCTCPVGYVQKSADNSDCVKPEDCPAKCPAPKVSETCPSKCQPTCQDPKPDKDACISGCRENECVCPEGMVLLNKESNECVKLSQCPECTAPAMPVECTPVCPESCKPRPFLCVRQCPTKYVCGCPGGFLLKTRESTECVKEEACPPPCDKPKRYANCASLCQPTCEVPKPGSCRRGCNPRKCFCPIGMVQPAEDDFSCVYLSDCPKKCDAPKEYQKCPSKCQPTCENPEPNRNDCDQSCREDVCVCPSGMVLLDEDSDKCVKPSQCPKRCDFPEVLSSCHSTCPARCDNLATLDLLDCRVDCSDEVCVCDDGYVQRSASDPTCVLVASCLPPPTTTKPDTSRCDAPKIYVECATRCPPTCALPDPITCSRACNPVVECECPTGWVQQDKKNTTCIKLSDCQVCKEPKVYVECASKCRPTCQTPNPVLCDRSCDPGIHCVCPPGMVHPDNGDDGCILLSQCPESCEFPTVASDCAPNCPATCGNPAPKCDKGCNRDVKCVCPIGLLYLNSTNLTCVLPSQCPGLPDDCPQRKIPTACASGCPATCQDQKPRFCTKPCRPGVKCECPSGMVQKSEEDDTCLWPYQCDL